MNEKISMPDLAVLLAEKADITQREAETFVKECFNIIQKALAEDKFLKIRNLGTFKLLLMEDRESIDVLTGERTLIPAHYKATFSPDVELAKTVNAPYASLEIIEIAENKLLKKEEDETEKIKTICQEPEHQMEKEEEPVFFKHYNKESKPLRRRNVFFENFFFIVSGCIFLFAGYYFYPKIRWGKIGHSIPDPAAAISYPVNNLSGSDRLKMQSFPADSVAMGIVDDTKVQTDNNRPSKTFVDKKYKILIGERINTIALREYGHKVFWVYIYDENRDVIHNPNLIIPGMTIRIPPAEKYGIDKNNAESVNKALKLEQKYKHP
jgi:nucleoid DNA-binding protein